MRLYGLQAGLLLAVLLCGGSQAQSPMPPIPNRPISDRQLQSSMPGVVTVNPMPGSKVRQDFLMRAEMERQRKQREERLKQLADDSERLTALASQLQQEIKVVSTAPVLPVASIKKADEIERLAKRLKQNLRGPA